MGALVGAIPGPASQPPGGAVMSSLKNPERFPFLYDRQEDVNRQNYVTFFSVNSTESARTRRLNRATNQPLTDIYWNLWELRRSPKQKKKREIRSNPPLLLCS